MALIACPECKNNVSSAASLCPQCGYVISVPKRSVFGMLCKWIFIGFNVLMLCAVIHGVYSASRMEAAGEAERAGRAVGTAIGVGFILAIWAAGSLILGPLVLFTKPAASIRGSRPARPSVERSNPTDEAERERQVPDLIVSGRPREAPDPSATGEPPWVIGQSSPRSIVGGRYLTEHGFGMDPRERGDTAAKPPRSLSYSSLLAASVVPA